MKSKQHSHAAFWRLITHDLQSHSRQVESFLSLRKPAKVVFICEAIMFATRLNHCLMKMVI